MTDANEWAAGFALMIEDYTLNQDGKQTKSYAPVAFGSRKFTQGQYNLTTHAKEFLAVYLAFDSFAHILWGIVDKPVIVLTDNIALASFLQAKTLPPTLCKYVDRILQFNFVLAHIPGKGNPVADYLSRMHHNPHLHLDLTVKGKIPVYDIQVELEPKVQGDLTQDGGRPDKPLIQDDTPDEWPPPSPDDDQDEIMEVRTEQPQKGICVSALAQFTRRREGQLNALQYPDPMQRYDMSERTARLDMGAEQNKDANIRVVKMWLQRNRIPDTQYLSTEMRSYHRQIKSLFIGPDGVLYRRFFKHNGRDFKKADCGPEALARGVALPVAPRTDASAPRGRRSSVGIPREVLLSQPPGRYREIYPKLYHVRADETRSR